jgi:hypothetical protein
MAPTVRLRRILVLSALALPWAATQAWGDFLILRNGKSYQGALTEYPDGTWSCSGAPYRYDAATIARRSPAATVEEAIQEWAKVLGEGSGGDPRLSLAKFCVFQRRNGEALKHFTAWAVAQGWTVSVSNYYYVLSNAQPKRILEIKGRLDAIVDQFQKDFKVDRRPGREFVVRFFSGEGEFDAFARTQGVTRAGGFFDPGDRELVLWDKSAVNKQYTFEAVYHEVNHQYLWSYFFDHGIEFYWFSEGLATYYETVEYQGGQITDVGKINRSHLIEVQSAIRENRVRPFAKFLTLKHDEFLEVAFSDLNYAQAWSIVYYCLHSPEPKARAFFLKYGKILRECKDDQKALEEALKGVDLESMQKSWTEYMKRL